MKRIKVWVVGFIFAGLAAGCSHQPASSPAPTPSRPSMQGIKEGTGGGKVRGDDSGR
jgi:hypothetical protein